MKIDVVCGRDVNEDATIKTSSGDRTYYFCSTKCQYDFATNPLRYLDKSHSASSTEGAPKLDGDGNKVRSRA